LGMLIPPSLLMIVFGLIAEQSIGDLFIAGIVPGIVLAIAFGLQILLVSYLAPRWVYVAGTPTRPTEQGVGTVDALKRLLPVLLLIGLGIGGIYVGWFTPTEAGAVGALGALVLAAWRRQLSWKVIWEVLSETGAVTVSIMFLIIAANIYSRLLAFSGMPLALQNWVSAGGFDFYTLLIIYAFIIVLLGTMIDAVSIMLIMVPMFLPLLKGFDVNLIWFGIVTVIAVEIGLLTPPMGLSVFTINSTLNDARIKLGDIFIGAAPYVVTMLLVTLLIIFVPEVTLVLLRK
jgi:C4-dicarboxylate transporter DctM subunit